ncbi:mechanosensitive ion channel family protein [Sciscionella marina]|uniref:mechanosensitive ion channel family protein n=1 Tax=Sciscionella marina TaxID=508770 RepID=UPI0012F69482
MTAMSDGFSFTQPFQNAFSTLMQYIPQLIGALVILLIGFFVAKAIAWVVSKVLEKAHFNDAMQRANVQQFLERAGTGLTASVVLGKVVFWFVFIIALTMFASALGVPQISGFLNGMIAYVPNIFAALVIVFLAALLGRFLAGIVRGFTGSEVLAKATNTIILVYAVFVALVQLRIAQQLTGPTFLIVLGGVALAGGLAFGLGGRDDAQQLIHNLATRGQNNGGHSKEEPAQSRPETPDE